MRFYRQDTDLPGNIFTSFMQDNTFYRWNYYRGAGGIQISRQDNKEIPGSEIMRKSS